MAQISCPLCTSTSQTTRVSSTGRTYYDCTGCGLIFMDPVHFLSPEEEKKFYLTHNNDVHDPRYQKFVSPITDYIKENIPIGSIGLDFGSGTGPVLWHVLREAGYAMEKFDPFFEPQLNCLEKKYNFVVTSEVVEHSQQPHTEFLKLRSMLVPGAPLVLMTLQYRDTISFETWFYAHDPTHVCFYRPRTLAWIAEELEFGACEVLTDRLAVLWNRASDQE